MTFSSKAALALFLVVLIAPSECDVRCELFDVDIQFEQDLPPGLARRPHQVHCRPEGSDETFEVVDLPPGFSVAQNPFVEIRGASINRASAKISQPPGWSIAPIQRPGGSRRRNLRRAATGTRSVLVVRVTATDASTTAGLSALSDSLFGTNGDPVNLKSQYEACSHNQLHFEPATGTESGVTKEQSSVVDGATEVSISIPVTGADDGTIRNAVTVAVKNKFGLASGSMYDNQIWDHMVYCLPPGTAGSWIAYAYINSQISVFNDVWCTYVSGQMHEIGHNINLAHSGEGTSSYGDQTGLMGYSYSQDDGPDMCFNNAKNWQLGWYAGCYTEVVPEVATTAKLIGVADYSITAQCVGNEAVVLKVPEPSGGAYYVGYNKQESGKMNSGTREAGNQVTVQYTVGDPGAVLTGDFSQDPGMYLTSDLVAKLSAGGSAALAGTNLIVKFCSLEGGQALVGISTATDPCLPPETCGDGIVNAGEACDDGNTVSNDGCSSTCVVEVCGDGIVNNAVEACDDGNTVSNDGCSSTCVVEVCGDGIVNNGVETCDDGNTASNDGCSSTCLVEICGDGILTSDTESCDDGNTVSNDGCSSTCVAEVCGDGIVNNGVETCDDGNTTPNDGCSSTCVVEVCGDGIVNNGVETCDDGNTVSNDGCSSTCVAEVCGDGIVNNGETCDDGNTAPNDGCSSTCFWEVCGDGIVNNGETCDDGNTVSNDGCSSTCVLEICGDGIVNNGAETCDDGNTVSNDGCSSTCVVEVCGDGIVNNGEACDDGNTVSNDGCSSTCVVEVCGDRIVNNGETCDDGNTASSDGCSSNCFVEICGDGILTSDTESCDDGNTVSNDGCSSACVVEVCGDGIVNNGVETCDDGNTTPNDGCSSTCFWEVCGDGIVNNGESCDDGNTVSNDGCSSACVAEVCGDGIVNNGVETCDDGNTASNDGCSSTCVVEICGDGILTSDTESCDDGNTVSNDGCSSTCVVEVCGDGIVNNGVETCDDGNIAPNDGCSSTCVVEVCGDGIVNNGETCDDGNTVSNDGCSSTCVAEVCGDGIVNNGEECDGIAGTPPMCSDGCSGTVTCGSNCRWNSAVCADGICDAAEALSACPANGNTCGDCVRSAPSSFCGDGVCDISLDASGRAKEDSINCNVDVGGDCQGTTGGKPNGRFFCGNDESGVFVGCNDPRCFGCAAVADQNACCGDGVCAVDAGETAVNCQADCVAECVGANDCDDGLSCTADSCDGGVCVNTPNCASGFECNLVTGSCDAPVDCTTSSDFPNCCCDNTRSNLGGKPDKRTCYDSGVLYNYGDSCPANGGAAFVSGPEKEAGTDSANSTTSGLSPTATTLLAVVVVLSAAVVVLAISLAVALRYRRQPQERQVVELPSGQEIWGRTCSLSTASGQLKASQADFVHADLEAAAGSV